MNIAKCGSCGASIVWACTEKGKMIPIDAIPRADGNMILTPDGIAHVLIPDGLFGTEDERYMTHWATCPDAKQHRKKSAEKQT
jgi:hypothetical protein